MKKGLLAGTALAGVAFLGGGQAGAAVEPLWRLSGSMNFQAYWIDQDYVGLFSGTGTPGPFSVWWSPTTVISNATAAGPQEHGWYFGVDESELRLDVSGTADNGLNYGFKVEINANTDDGVVADEARLEFSGFWGTLQLGDEDGAEDVMNYGGETLMGATGGIDGDHDDYLFRGGWLTSGIAFASGAQSFAAIAGDTADSTKISYFTPRVSGFQFGVSFTPTPNDGDETKADGDWEDHIGLGLNYDGSFGGFRVRASAVYSTAASTVSLPPLSFSTQLEDTAAWSAGAILGWGPFSVAGNITDNGDSGYWVGSGVASTYWNAAASYRSGRVDLAAGDFESRLDWGAVGPWESIFTITSVTADYSAAPGLGIYAELDLVEDQSYTSATVNNAIAVILGARVSF